MENKTVYHPLDVFNIKDYLPLGVRLVGSFSSINTKNRLDKLIFSITYDGIDITNDVTQHWDHINKIVDNILRMESHIKAPLRYKELKVNKSRYYHIGEKPYALVKLIGATVHLTFNPIVNIKVDPLNSLQKNLINPSLIDHISRNRYSLSITKNLVCELRSLDVNGFATKLYLDRELLNKHHVQAERYILENQFS